MCFFGHHGQTQNLSSVKNGLLIYQGTESKFVKSMGTSCSKCECNYSETEETVNAIRGHLEETLSGMSHGFHLDTVWKTVLAIGTIEVLLLIGHKLYRVTYTLTKTISSGLPKLATLV